MHMMVGIHINLLWKNLNIPDALPIRFVSLKPIVTAKHNIISVQLISGIYICP